MESYDILAYVVPRWRGKYFGTIPYMVDVSGAGQRLAA